MKGCCLLASSILKKAVTAVLPERAIGSETFDSSSRDLSIVLKAVAKTSTIGAVG